MEIATEITTIKDELEGIKKKLEVLSTTISRASASEFAKADASEFAKADASEFAKADASEFAKADASEFAKADAVDYEANAITEANAVDDEAEANAKAITETNALGTNALGTNALGTNAVDANAVDANALGANALGANAVDANAVDAKANTQANAVTPSNIALINSKTKYYNTSSTKKKTGASLTYNKIIELLTPKKNSQEQKKIMRKMDNTKIRTFYGDTDSKNVYTAVMDQLTKARTETDVQKIIDNYNLILGSNYIGGTKRKSKSRKSRKSKSRKSKSRKSRKSKKSKRKY